MEVGIVRRVDIDQQMQEAYLDYAMSVIVSRALPDVRDGLKPVHRRILYAMHDMGLRASQPYKKSARIVGEVLGKYHPHGDAAVYEAMVRMAQDFAMRLPLIDGQGNFGSIDGDPPAAMRYTEARMASLANEIMADIDKATVEFVDNFDGSLTEPDVLPTKVPNFLVNGAAGIAVGMATSVPPHNLGEVCDALTFMLEQMAKNKDVGIDDLLKFIKGPDFPTGGIVYRYAGEKASPDGENDLIKTAYAAGRGRITVQAKAHIEEMSRNRHRLVITELPYQTNKSALAEKIAELARDGKIEGLADLRDESDRQGMRLVIELTRTVEPMEVLKQLFKLTPLQSTFSINMLALVEGEPRLLPLKRALQLFIEHRQQVITRRSQYELNQARQRAHILEGLRTALAHLDEVIETIRHSQSADTARENLRKKFKLSEAQATAILDMPLRRLAALERKKIETEYKEVLVRIKYLEDLLKNPKKILGVIKEELAELKAKYDSPRRTTIVDQTANNGRPVTAGDLVPAEAVVVAVSQSGRVCRWPAAEGLEPARGKQADPLAVAVPAHTRDTLYLFTAAGRTIIIPMHQMPVGSGPGDGPSLSEFSSGPVQPIVAGLAIQTSEVLETSEVYPYLCLVTQQGKVKRVLLSDLDAVRGSEAVVIGLDKGDRLLTAFATPGEGELLLVSAQGQAIRFAEEEVRPMGLPAAGVMGMKLGGNDQLVGAGLVKARRDVALVTRQGVGKRTEMSEFPKQGRHGQGVIALKLAAGDSLAAAATLKGADRVMLLSQKGNNKTVFAKSLPKLGRAQKGQELIAIRGKDQVVRLITLDT
ncbi:MAG: DNA gyrase subunit A [Chloroflexota bacterium]|nr:MAG: DNA gyrase subunit A [Chloroflexota bacterium]